MKDFLHSYLEREDTQVVYLSSAYLAPIQYYSKMLKYEQVYIETACHFVKQTYRNRCIIAGANGPLTLSIPVDKQGVQKCNTKDILIDIQTDWQRQHWRSIVSAYRTSPFFEFFEDDFRPFYEKKWKYLWDFNASIQELVLSLLTLPVSVNETISYAKTEEIGASDLRELIHPKKNALLSDTHFKSVVYYQVFDQKLGFLPNLSIIDLLFNMGNEARLVLKQSWQ